MCVCGKRVKKCNLTKHKKTKKHNQIKSSHVINEDQYIKKIGNDQLLCKCHKIVKNNPYTFKKHLQTKYHI